MNSSDNPEKPRLCFALRRDKATVYGNRPAFKKLIERLQFIIAANPAEHFEIHAFYAIDEGRSSKEPSEWNSWVLAEEELHERIAWPDPGEFEGKKVFCGGFDFNIMAVTEADLDELSSYRSDGILPTEREDD